MRFLTTAVAALLAAASGVVAAPPPCPPGTKPSPKFKPSREHKIKPKVFIVSLFSPEANTWYENLPSSGLGDLMAVNITTPGLSPLFPYIHCVSDFSICQMTTGESEINAASTVMAALLSGYFDVSSTYFMVAGIAGINPKYGTLGSVALARYSIQVALQYEFDSREMPSNWSTGYFGYGTDAPDIYPGNQYGTEVLEISETLRDLAYGFASKANMSDNDIAAEYRAKFAGGVQGSSLSASVYAPATEPPSVIKCDSVTSDVYFSGNMLSEAFESVTKVWTNGSGEYCMTAQEDNAVLEVLVRLAIDKLVDFSRVIVMRTGSDFDRPPADVTAFDNLRIVDQNGFGIAIENIFNAGVEIVKGILGNWDSTFAAGVTPTNYIGDIFGSLGGNPDFGPGSLTDGVGYLPDGKSGESLRRRTLPANGLGRKAGYAKRSAVVGRREEARNLNM